MDVAAAGGLIIFFSLLIALILVALLVFSYAAYSFLLTLTSSAAGNDEVLWPGEPIQDWLFKVWYLGWLVALCAVPTSLVLGLLRLERSLFVLYLAALLWLIFPVSLLSSLSAQTRLVVFRPVIVRLLLKHFGTTVGFYVSSGFVFLVCGVLGYGAIFGWRSVPALNQPVILVPLAGAVGAAACLVYARLLGRTAYIISQSRGKRRKKADPERPEEADRVETFDPWSAPQAEPLRSREPSKEVPKKTKPPAKSCPQVHDPWAVPPNKPLRKPRKPTPSAPQLPEDPDGPVQGSYELMAENAPLPAPPPPRRRSAFAEEEPEPYAVSAAAESAPTKQPDPVVPEVSKLEEELAAPRRLPPLPNWPMINGVYSFPGYPQSVGPYATLAVGFVGVLALVRIVIYAYPL
jgi:hypothetical protein